MRRLLCAILHNVHGTYICSYLLVFIIAISTLQVYFIFCGSALCNLFLTPLSAHVFCLFLVELANDVSSTCPTSFSSLSLSLCLYCCLSHTRLARFLNDKIQEIFGVGLLCVGKPEKPTFVVSKVVKRKRYWNSIFENASALSVRLAMTFTKQLPSWTRHRPHQTWPLDKPQDVLEMDAFELRLHTTR